MRLRERALRFAYFFGPALWESFKSFFTVMAGAVRIWRQMDSDPASILLPDTDDVIAQMDADEFCTALNKAMYRHPEDPDMLYPDWFVELAREGIYLAGVMALNEELVGQCVVKVNGMVIHFDAEAGAWSPREHAA